jgi:hypothetical protein
MAICRGRLFSLVHWRSKVLLQSVILAFGALWGLPFCSQHATLMKSATLTEEEEQQMMVPQFEVLAQVRQDLKGEKSLSELKAIDNADLRPRIPDAVHGVPTVQVFITTAPSLGENWDELFYLNSNGWHTQFPDLQVFTFDKVVSGSPIRGFIEELPKFKGEKSERHSNLLLAAIGASYRRNPNSSWYLLAEDDTIVARTSLEEMVSKLDPNMPQVIGKCVGIKNVPFVVGGAGMLLSHALVADLAPHIDACRSDRKISRGFGDLRVSKCIIKHNLTWNGEWTCPPQGYIFADFYIATRDDRFVTIHRKEPALIRHMNEAVAAISTNNSAVTWGSLFDHFNVSSGKEFGDLWL